jgi:hypothetical protein
MLLPSRSSPQPLSDDVVVIGYGFALLVARRIAPDEARIGCKIIEDADVDQRRRVCGADQARQFFSGNRGI